MNRKNAEKRLDAHKVEANADIPYMQMGVQS
jgi:hypothetical protein